MYKIAVILNESELLRSGYANVTPKLESLSGLSKYHFESFTVVNIGSLFQTGGNSLKDFDSLFITTNATSDSKVLETLRQNAEQIQAFIDDGKGIFISSQKKLSADSVALEKGEGNTGFLPPQYEFATAERPKAERDSGVGKISTHPDGANHLLLWYPKQVTPVMIEKRCESNEFRRHFYRSHLLPKSSGAYLPLLADTSYRDPDCRVLFMVGRAPQRNERIVISTVALDWEFHGELLTNIVTYITEGPPNIAFIKKPNSSDSDYDFLITSTELSKTPYAVYTNPLSIPERLVNVHNTYIFSRGWTNGEIANFLRSKAFRGGDNEPRPAVYRRAYFFQQLEELLVLTQHSTFSTVDVMIDKSVMWLSSQFRGRMWGGSFWITHDVLAMMQANRIDHKIFVAPVLSDIGKHCRDGSYDGVMGATCGLLELLVQLWGHHPDVCQANGFGLESINRTCDWIVKNYKFQSLNDKISACLVLKKVLAGHSYARLDKMKLKEKDLQVMLEDVVDHLQQEQLTGENFTEIDLCLWIAFYLLCGQESHSRLIPLLANLKQRQSVTGEWTDITRTAHVLEFLLENVEALRAIEASSGTTIGCEDMIHNGVLALRARYNEEKANWDFDLQATTKAIHVIGLYNSLYKYSTQDFLTTLKADSENMESGALLRDLGNALDKLRHEANKLVEVASKLRKDVRRNARIAKLELAWRLVAFASLFMFTGMVAYLAVEHRDLLVQSFQAVGLLSILASVVISLAASWIVGQLTKKYKMSDEHKESKTEGKTQ